jgi:polyisoprenoid-binding protein YceI
VAALMATGVLVGAVALAAGAERVGARKTFSVDGSASRMSVQTETSGLSSLFGHDHRFDTHELTGSVRLDVADPGASSLRITVKAGSLRLQEDVAQPVRDEIESALRTRVLEVSRYPTISFQSHQVAARKVDEGIFDAQLTGDLRLHGVRRTVTIPARVTVGTDRIRAAGSFTLLQSDFDIAPFRFKGNVSVEDRVTISFDVVAPASGTTMTSAKAASSR